MIESCETIYEVERQLYHLKQTFDNIGAYVYTKDIDGNYTFANKMVCDLFQLSIEEIIGKSDENFFDLTKSNELRVSDRIVLDNNQRIEKQETNHIKSTNETRTYWSVKQPLHDQFGRVTGLCGISTDITEKLQAEKKLQKANQLLNSILNHAPASIFMKNTDLKYSYANLNAVKDFNKNLNEIIGKTDKEIFPLEVAENLNKIDRQVLISGEKFEGEEILLNLKGKVRHYSVVKVPLKSEDKIDGLIGIAYDITDRMQLKRKLQKQNIRLKSALEERNLFMGMVVHDLRNPISSIMSISEIIEGEAISETVIELTKLVQQASSNMLTLVDSLLDVSEIESGNLSLRKQEIDYINFADQIVDLNQFIAAKKNITIEKIFEIPAHTVEIDKLKIEQVFNNLIGNAIKFSHPETRIVVKISVQNDQIITEVIDQGQGIKPEEIKNIFQYFKKSSTIPTHNEHSHGLGLPIVKKIVEGHYGTITVASELGKGSTFTFILPDSPLSL